MRILISTAALTAALALPATSLSTPSKADRAQAVQDCRVQRAQMGIQPFRDLHGTNKTKRNAFGKCVSKLARKEAANRQNAARECRAERADDSAAFAEKYGTNRNKRNAFGKCVSQKAHERSEAQQKATIEAAKECKAERAKDPAAFRSKYGTNANKRNAFGKCVSKLASRK